MLLPAPGLSASKKMPVTKGIATRNPGIATRRLGARTRAFASICLAQGLDHIL